MTSTECLQELESLSNPATLKHDKKLGAPENCFGVKMGDIRKIAKKLKTNHSLALELWETENVDARLLACLILDVPALSEDQLNYLVESTNFSRLADWVNSYVVKNHPAKMDFRETWMNSENPWAARAGWNLTASIVVKNKEGLDLSAILDRIENEMPTADPLAQWTMNFALGYIGINHAEHRDRSIEIGEKIGAYKDYPEVKGCISPYVPIWVSEMVSRQK